MGAMPKYTKKFKTRLVARMMGPNAVSATDLGEETGISQSTLSAWLREARTLGGTMPDSPTLPTSSTPPTPSVPTTTPTRPRGARSVEEQLHLLALAATLTGEELGAMLRREGVHAAELEGWRHVVAEALQGRSPASAPVMSSADRKRIQHLERELDRKEKALAEAAVLLLLQKKVRVYLGDEDERTDERSGR